VEHVALKGVHQFPDQVANGRVDFGMEGAPGAAIKVLAVQVGPFR